MFWGFNCSQDQNANEQLMLPYHTKSQNEYIAKTELNDEYTSIYTGLSYDSMNALKPLLFLIRQGNMEHTSRHSSGTNLCSQD